MLQVCFDAYGLDHYEFIPEGRIVNKKKMSISFVPSGMRWEGNVRKNGHEAASFFCTTTHLHKGRWRSKSILPSIMWWLWLIRYIPSICHRRLLFVPATKCVLKRQRFATLEEVIEKAMRELPGTEKWFPGMLPNILRVLEKVCYFPRELLSRKCTYFCVIYQFRKFFVSNAQAPFHCNSFSHNSLNKMGVNGKFQERRLVSTFYTNTDENHAKPQGSRSRGRYEHFPDSSLRTSVNPCRQICTAIRNNTALWGIMGGSCIAKGQKSSQ
jgi:hypothetical protein